MDPKIKQISDRVTEAYKTIDELGWFERIGTWWHLRAPLREARRARRKARRTDRR